MCKLEYVYIQTLCVHIAHISRLEVVASVTGWFGGIRERIGRVLLVLSKNGRGREHHWIAECDHVLLLL